MSRSERIRVVGWILLRFVFNFVFISLVVTIIEVFFRCSSCRRWHVKNVCLLVCYGAAGEQELQYLPYWARRFGWSEVTCERPTPAEAKWTRHSSKSPDISFTMSAMDSGRLVPSVLECLGTRLIK